MRLKTKETIRTQIRPGKDDFTPWIKTDPKGKYFRIPLRMLDPDDTAPQFFDKVNTSEENEQEKVIKSIERDASEEEFKVHCPRKHGISSPQANLANKKTKTDKIDDEIIMDMIQYLDLTIKTN